MNSNINLKPGRPKTLNKKIIAAKCYKVYWEKGINNVTYNDVIKYSGISKFSFYKTFKDEDELQRESIKFYYESYMSEIIKEVYKYNDVLSALSFFDNKNAEKNYKPCFFNACNYKKYELGNKTKNILKKIEVDCKKMFFDLITRHVKFYNFKINKIDIKALSSFLVHSFNLINILLLNKASSEDIIIIKKNIKEKIISDLNIKKIGKIQYET